MDHRFSLPFATLAVVALVSAAGCNDTDGSAPATQGGTGGVGGSPGASDTGGGGVAGSPGASDTEGMAGTGGDSGATCATRHPASRPEPSGAPGAIGKSGTGSGVLSLDEKFSGGWLVSLLSGDLTPAPVVMGSELLPSLVVGDQVEVTARQTCQTASGCKSFVVVRNAKDHALITADFSDDPSQLVAFGELLHVGLELEPICATAPTHHCYENEVQTQFRLLVEADDSVAINQRARRSVTIEGQPYTLWVGAAFTNAASGPRILRNCLDAELFWWPGAVTLTITP